MTIDPGWVNGGVLGLVGMVVMFILREFRKIKLQNNRTQQVIPHEVRSSAATTFEAEQAAARKSFDQDRALKDNTILDLQLRVEEVKEELREQKTETDFEHTRFLAEREKRRTAEAEVEVLKERVRELQRQAAELLDTIEEMSDRLSVERELEDEQSQDPLHLGPGS